jgi:formamidopyrimidine-DNA glycosylase
MPTTPLTTPTTSTPPTRTMPELPEVELAAAYVRARLVGVDGLVCALAEARRDAALDALVATRTQRLDGVRRHGKQLALDFDSGHTLLLHLGMTGRFGPPDSGTSPPPHTRFTLATPDAEPVHFIDPRRFARFVFCSRDDAEKHPAWTALGPDALAAGDDDWCVALTSAGPIKPALLDQHRIAGVGNIYACEGLWAAGIHPQRRGADLSPDEIGRLRQAIQAAMRETLRRDADTPMRYLNEGEVENPFAIYARERSPCPRCGASIERIKQTGRSTWMCPSCQPAPRDASGRP